MKQYTTPEQTAKLIELGYFRPALSWRSPFGGREEIIRDPFSIGELLSFLPTHYDTGTKRFELTIAYSVINGNWIVGGTRYPKDNTYGTELIDALYDMVVNLKEEGIIR